MQRAIPDEHRDRLVAAGYVRAIAPYSPGRIWAWTASASRRSDRRLANEGDAAYRPADAAPLHATDQKP